MRKAFTLVELLLSVAIFSIVAVFLFETISLNKRSTQTVVNKTDKLIARYKQEDIIAKDLLYAKEVAIQKDKDDNTQLFITTKNSYENTFNDKVLYLLTKQNTLYRIENDKKITRKNIYNLDPTYIHALFKDVEKFRVSAVKHTQGVYAVYILFTNGEEKLFAASTF